MLRVSGECRIRGQRHAHDVERVAVMVVLGVKPRQGLQRLDLGLVAAPGGGENLQFADEVGLLGFAERIAKRDLAKPALRRRRPVVGCRLRNDRPRAHLRLRPTASAMRPVSTETAGSSRVTGRWS